jgi:hypothetical protein
MDTILPKRFAELSLQSLTHDVEQSAIQLNQQLKQQDSPYTSMQVTRYRLPPISLKPRHTQTIVAAVDTSTIKIGETLTGLLVAVRSATVWKQNGNYHYNRLGPFVFHITEENKTEVYTALERTYFSAQYGQYHHAYPSLLQMPTRIASLLEKWLQLMLSRTISNGLVLFDGSLTAGTPDTPTALMKDVLSTARVHGNLALAFSKATTLRVNGHLITDLPQSYKPPYLLEMDGIRSKPPTVLLGDVYVAKLTNGSYAFRLDIDREATIEQRIWAVEKLLTNDSITQSYPETLRLAHILCTFTANEVIAMQQFSTRKYGLKLVNRPDMHYVLFGPFGRGEYCS